MKIQETTPYNLNDLIAYLLTSKIKINRPPFTFFLSLGGSFNALMMSDAAEGTTDIAACLFWMVRQTVIFRPFQSAVAFAMSSPTFLGD